MATFFPTLYKICRRWLASQFASSGGQISGGGRRDGRMEERKREREKQGGAVEGQFDFGLLYKMAGLSCNACNQTACLPACLPASCRRCPPLGQPTRTMTALTKLRLGCRPSPLHSTLLSPYMLQTLVARQTYFRVLVRLPARPAALPASQLAVDRGGHGKGGGRQEKQECG